MNPRYITEFPRIFGEFIYAGVCAILGICCESTAQAMNFTSHKLMRAADALWDAALKVKVWD
jgi:hypothetical protein